LHGFFFFLSFREDGRDLPSSSFSSDGLDASIYDDAAGRHLLFLFFPCLKRGCRRSVPAPPFPSSFSGYRTYDRVYAGEISVFSLFEIKHGRCLMPFFFLSLSSHVWLPFLYAKETGLSLLFFFQI